MAHFLLLNQPYSQHPHLQRITFIDQCYREIKPQWQELMLSFSEATSQQVNNNPNTLAIIAELDLRYALHTVGYHSREYHSVYNDVMEQGFHIAGATNMVQMATKSVANLAKQLPNHALLPVIKQHHQQTVELHNAMVASFNQKNPPTSRQQHANTNRRSKHFNPSPSSRTSSVSTAYPMHPKPGSWTSSAVIYITAASTSRCSTNRTMPVTHSYAPSAT